MVRREEWWVRHCIGKVKVDVKSRHCDVAGNRNGL